MSSRMVRCRQGHVFDAIAHAACPACQEATASVSNEAASGSTNSAAGSGAAPPPSPPSHMLLIGAGVAVLALILLIVAWSVNRSTPTPPPITHDEKKTDQKTAEDDSRSSKGDHGLEYKTPIEFSPGSSAATEDKGNRQASKNKPAANLPAPDYKEIAKLLGVSELVVDLTAYFALKKQAGTQPTPQIIAAYDGLSKRGIGPATLELANDYLNGRGVAQSDGTAIQYFKTAAEQGQSVARFVLAKFYQEGLLITSDQEQANMLLALAIREGVPPALEVARNNKIDPARVGMSSRELFEMAARGNPKVVDAANGFIKDGLASGYAALAFYAVEHSKDERLRQKAPEFAANAAKAGLDAGFSSWVLIYASSAIVPANDIEAAMWAALSLQVCGAPVTCGPAKNRLAALKEKLDRNVAGYLDNIDEHLLKAAGGYDPLLEHQR